MRAKGRLGVLVSAAVASLSMAPDKPAPSPSPAPDAKSGSPEKQDKTTQVPKPVPSYTDDDLDHIAGRKTWAERKNEAEAKRTDEPDREGTIDSPAIAPRYETAEDGSSQRKNEAGSSPEVGSDRPPAAAPEPGEPSDPGGGEESPAPRKRGAALADEIVKLEAQIQSLDNEAGKLLNDRLMSSDTNEILRLQAEQGEVLKRLEEAKKRLAEARAEADQPRRR